MRCFYILVCFVYIYIYILPISHVYEYFRNASGISSWTWSPATRASFAGGLRCSRGIVKTHGWPWNWPSNAFREFLFGSKVYPDSLGFCWAIIARSKSLRQEKLHSSKAGITNGNQPLTMRNTSRGTGECSWIFHCYVRLFEGYPTNHSAGGVRFLVLSLQVWTRSQCWPSTQWADRVQGKETWWYLANLPFVRVYFETSTSIVATLVYPTTTFETTAFQIQHRRDSSCHFPRCHQEEEAATCPTLGPTPRGASSGDPGSRLFPEVLMFFFAKSKQPVVSGCSIMYIVYIYMTTYIIYIHIILVYNV